MVWVFFFILKVKGLNFTNVVFVVNNDKLLEYVIPLNKCLLRLFK
jgi:hypothetical protein